ncbi:Fanconi anemia group E protein isoform X1 [Thalassophryne amazonica]|uniref:Fanconi anemia group E protein isoform X1 n=1 Tax=Thalassophryne amazonica TaxID=390379 RepID=UPI001472381D|nr:Fanconi anemia group E protein isoform X1 [Thalassophryne amazonica]
MFEDCFDSRSKLLVRSLLSGVSGAHRALTVYQKQRRTDREASLLGFIETLCRDQVSSSESDTKLTVKPLVCLFPALFKQNLLSFIHLVHSVLPRATVIHLLECLHLEPQQNSWVTALIKQLERNLGINSNEPLCSPQCSQRLTELLQRLRGAGETSGWAELFNGQTETCQRVSVASDGRTQMKRKGSFVSVDSEGDEMEQQSKRMKMGFFNSEDHDAEEKELNASEEETSHRLEAFPHNGPAEELQPAPKSLCDVLPEHVKVSGLQIKELLESQAEWDQSATELFRVLNDCDATQVEVLCSMLGLPDLPEHMLPKLCNSVLALSPDLSYSTAAKLFKSLLQKKIVSLSEPASRCLLTSVTSLCSRYPRPICHAVIEPVLDEHNIGSPQAELLNRLIEDCLGHHYRLLVLQMTFRVVWSEAVLSIIHRLLDSKPDLSEELFSHLTEKLTSQAPQFTKSVMFAKMMLTVLTKYTTLVTAAHKHALSGCLTLNETFLKKSLQAALKRITLP